MQTERDWNTWDDSPRTVEEHIEKYRERLAQPPTPDTPAAPEVDFFTDMTPKTFEQPKLFIPTGTETADERSFNRLQADALDIPVINELKDWEELEQRQGWDEVDDESTRQMIRDNRKELRQQKHQQRHQYRH